ncbi:hypothetical protein [Trueperella abortisuis]|uniref:Uncharacterized protein n=1 Tax=Trueperella abortisuis TaxID=445930 RepID=A0ABT9PJ95_9ACTO|nr:hypothetical protein [Trueperella abortisuis]MDP9832789.1 hypothetical protein [Trueperella abortisuis]
MTTDHELCIYPITAAALGESTTIDATLPHWVREASQAAGEVIVVHVRPSKYEPIGSRYDNVRNVECDSLWEFIASLKSRYPDRTATIGDALSIPTTGYLRMVAHVTRRHDITFARRLRFRNHEHMQGRTGVDWADLVETERVALENRWMQQGLSPELVAGVYGELGNLTMHTDGLTEIAEYLRPFPRGDWYLTQAISTAAGLLGYHMSYLPNVGCVDVRTRYRIDFSGESEARSLLSSKLSSTPFKYLNMYYEGLISFEGLFADVEVR